MSVNMYIVKGTKSQFSHICKSLLFCQIKNCIKKHGVHVVDLKNQKELLKHRKRRWDEPFCLQQKFFNESGCLRDRLQPVCSPDGFLYFGHLMRKSELNALTEGSKPRDKVVEYVMKPQFALLPISEQLTVLALSSYLLGYQRQLNVSKWRKKHLSTVMHTVLGTISYKIGEANIHEALNVIVGLVETITRKRPVVGCYKRDEFRKMCKKINSTLLKKTEKIEDSAKVAAYGKTLKNNENLNGGGNAKLTSSKTVAFKEIPSWKPADGLRKHKIKNDGKRAKRGDASVGDRNVSQGGKACKKDTIGLFTERVVECLNKPFPKTEKKTKDKNTETTDTAEITGTSETLGNRPCLLRMIPLDQDKDNGSNELKTFCYNETERKAIEERVLCEKVVDIVEKYKLFGKKMKIETASPEYPF